LFRGWLAIVEQVNYVRQSAEFAIIQYIDTISRKDTEKQPSLG